MQRLAEEAIRTEQNRARQLEIEERRRRREAADARLQALLSHHAWDSSHNLARFDEPEGAQAELDELRQEIEALKKNNQLEQAVTDLQDAERDINSSVMSSETSGERQA